MLILTRRVGERLCIGDQITISVEQVQGLQVRIGIAAPKEIPVHRQEVFERIQNQAADRNTCTEKKSVVPVLVHHRRRLGQRD